MVTCKATLAKWLGRARVTKPIALETWMVMIAQGGAKMNSQDEAGVVTYMTVNLPLGTRAIDMWLLDWNEVVWSGGSIGVSSRATGETAPGVVFNHLVSKSNREALEKPKPLHCLPCCDGTSPVASSGTFRPGNVCPVCLLQYYKGVQAKAAGVACDELIGPVWGRYLRIAELPAGATLVASDDDSSCAMAGPLVRVVSRAEEAAGEMYTGSQPMLVDGEERRPVCRGKYFEVAKLGY